VQVLGLVIALLLSVIAAQQHVIYYFMQMSGLNVQSVQKAGQTEAARALKEQVAGINSSIALQAAQIVHDLMPKKIIELQRIVAVWISSMGNINIFQSELFSLERFRQASQGLKSEVQIHVSW